MGGYRFLIGIVALGLLVGVLYKDYGRREVEAFERTSTASAVERQSDFNKEDIELIKNLSPIYQTNEGIVEQVGKIRKSLEEIELENQKTEEEMLAMEETLERYMASGQEANAQIQKSIENYGIRMGSLSEYQKLVTTMYSWIGVPYVWGGTTMNGADCSGFVQNVYRQLGYELPRVSKDQSKHGLLVDRQHLVFGDLLFFDTSNARDASDIKTPSQEMQYAEEINSGIRPNVVSHVGIFIGDGTMIHASSGDGYVTFADLESSYYRNRFINARRIIGE